MRTPCPKQLPCSSDGYISHRFFWFPAPALIFSFVCASALLLAAVVRADELKKRARDEPYVGKIKQVYPDGSVAIEVTNVGEIAINKDAIEWVKVEPPPDLQGLLDAMEAQRYAAAAQGLKPTVDRLVGLPEQSNSWVSDAT